jgi:hypothetical protein
VCHHGDNHHELEPCTTNSEAMGLWIKDKIVKVLEPIESSSKSLINLEKILILFYGLLGIRMLWFLLQEPLVVSVIVIRSHNISHHQLDGSNSERNIPEQKWSLEVEHRGMG